MSAPDYVIAGQGIAGSVFALSAIERGLTVQVVDPEETITCSRIAAGLMNPLSGPRLALGENEEALWFTARAFYRRWEETLGVSFFKERPILRLFTDPAQASAWTKRLRDPRYDPWHEPLPEEWERCAPFGGFTTKRCGRLDPVAFLDATRAWLQGRGAYRRGSIDAEDGAAIVWCIGHFARGHGPFQEIPLRPARGSILTLRAPGFREERILHAGKWLLPLGQGVFRAGSSYEWDPADSLPSRRAREEIAAFASQWIGPDWTLLQEEAAIRPMARQGRPILGPHPRDPRQILFNGLGSRGAMLAPWHAGRLLDHLAEGTAPTGELDLARFFG